MRIGVDVDDVVVDLLTPWLKRIARAVGKPEDAWTPDDITQWEFWNDLGVERSLVWSVYTPDIYDEALPHAGARGALQEIRRLGHQVVFVTQSVDAEMFRRKVLWLDEHGISEEGEIAYAVGEWTPFKSKADPLLDLDWLVDDHVGNLDGFPGYPVLMTRPHNRRLVTPHRRAKTLGDVALMLKYQASPEELRKPAGSTLDQIDESYNYAADHCAGLAPRPGQPACTIGHSPTVLIPPAPEPGVSPVQVVAEPKVRTFATGATRDTDHGKFDYEAFLSPLVLERYAAFMHKNRYQRDGTVRDGDNWQKGIPVTAYMKSMWRHFMDLWKAHRGVGPVSDREAADLFLEEALTAIMFNAMGYLHEHLKAKSLQDNVA